MSGKPVVTSDDSEQRFVAWVEKLELSFQNYLSKSSEEGFDKESLLNSIRDTLQSDTVNYPKWISLQKTVKLGKFASSSTDLKVFLRHVTFPGVLQCYHDLHTELSKSVAAGEKSHTKQVMDITPVTTSKDGGNDNAVRDFFQGISSANPDGLMGLCKLADIHHRINRAAEHDCHQVSTWLENEQSRGVNSERNLAERQVKIQQLAGKDQQMVLETSFNGLKTELGALNDALVRAEEEEELARKAYEAAVQRKKVSLDKLSNMETFIESATSQREVLRKIHSIRLDMDQFNRDSAKQRVGLFQGVMSYLTRVRSDVMDDRLVKEIPALFNNLVGLFSASSEGETNGNGSTKFNASLYCASRVGKETIRLWRQLNADHLYPALGQQMDDFGVELYKLQTSLVTPTPSDAESKSVFRSDNTTVVLYFDHLYHDTPEAHVEAQSRVSTCMKMLSTRLTKSSGYDAQSSNDAYRCRKMHILNCNDVLAPPTWCLPLTHSPQYLAHLWRLAEEACEGDLYVPLEFDTEWESEDPYRSGSDDEDVPGSRRHAGHLHKTMALPKRVSGMLGETASQGFSSLLTPDEGDAVIAKVIRKLEQREAAKMSARRRRDGDYSSAGKARNRRRRISSSDALGGDITRVKTPYGSGTLLPVTGAPRTDGIQEVRMDYGAIGYFHSSCIQFVPAENNDENMIGSGASSGRPRGRQSGGEGRSDDSRFVNTDLRLHRVLQRMVARVKIQRILGDLIGLNHANLSLWMHGRTSAGLNKTVEKSIYKFLTRYDRKQLNRLLLDTDNDEYSPENAANFLSRLEKTKIRSSSSGEPEASSSEESSDEDGNVSKKRFMLNSDSEFDSDVERVNALKYSEDKVQRKFASGGGSRDDLSGLGKGGRPQQRPDGSRGRLNSFEARSGGSSSVRPSVEARIAAKMSPDGEALRNLMTSIMRDLKISQGAIATEYCKTYRFDTSQGGVSAWFHYRGVASTFNRMNRCALMWVDSYRDELSSSERIQFDQLRTRMSAADVGDEDEDEKESSSPVRVNRRQGRKEDVPDEDEEDEEEEVRGLDIDEDDDQGTVAADEEKRIIGDEEVADMATVEENDEDEEDGSLVMDAESVDNAAQQQLEEEMASASVEGVPEEETVDEMQVQDGAEASAVVKKEGSQTEATGKKEETASSAVVKTELAVDGVEEEEEDDNLRYCDAPPTSAYVKEVRTIADLHTAVLYEMYRRHVTLDEAVDEAVIDKVGMGKVALSKFMRIATVTNNQRGSKFCQLMLKWLEFSRDEVAYDRSPAAAAERAAAAAKKEELLKERSGKPSRSKPDQNFDPHTCGICNKHVSEFSNHKSFHMHISWCYRRKAGVEPPLEYKMKSLGGGGGEDGAGRGRGGVAKRKASDLNDKDDDEDADSKRPRGGEDSSRRKQSDQKAGASAGRGKSSLQPEDLATDGVVLVADYFAMGDHYDSCDVCRERDVQQPPVLKCASCPCVYHWKCCAESNKGAAYPAGKWHCVKCVESGAHQAELMSLEMKNSTTVENNWILVYSSVLRRWRKAIVIAKHPTKYCCILAKWWRSDNRGGKTIWMDITKATILITTGEMSASAYSRNKMQQLSHNSHKQLGVKFEDQGRALNAQFKSQRGSGMHMDGVSNGSVPPGSQAAAAGVGGVGALEGDEKGQATMSGNGMSDTYISSNSLKAALCAAGTSCRAVDIAMCNENTNVFACIRPPGHHAGRYGCTGGCLSTGFCLLNNAALAAYYSRVRWGLERVAVIDIDVHFGNGTAELLRNDPNAFFASVHMIYGLENDGGPEVEEAHKKINAGFYPSLMGQTVVSDNYVSVGVYPSDEAPSSTRSNKSISFSSRKKKVVDPASDSSSSSDEDEEEEDNNSLDESAMVISDEALSTADTSSVSVAPTAENGSVNGKKDKKEDDAACPHKAARKTYKGSEGFIRALGDVIIPQMIKFNPQLLIISAGFDGYVSDPIGGQLSLSLDDYTTATKMLTSAMDLVNANNGTTSGPSRGRVISLLEGGYDTSPFTLGLARCVDAHVLALQES